MIIHPYPYRYKGLHTQDPHSESTDHTESPTSNSLCPLNTPFINKKEPAYANILLSDRSKTDLVLDSGAPIKSSQELEALHRLSIGSRLFDSALKTFSRIVSHTRRSSFPRNTTAQALAEKIGSESSVIP
jgi:hypothetical protein